MSEKIAEDVKCVYFKISRAIWENFKTGCHEVGLPASTYLRTMIYKELRMRDELREKSKFIDG